jgi:hypothetical protein
MTSQDATTMRAISQDVSRPPSVATSSFEEGGRGAPQETIMTVVSIVVENQWRENKIGRNAVPARLISIT